MKRIENFNGGWRFRKLPEGWTGPENLPAGEAVTLPHTWYADGDYYRGDAAYDKCFDWTPAEGERVFLRFDAVDKVCRVWLNGAELGGHAGAYTRFALELTEALRAGENRLTVLVNNEAGSTVSPLSGDFASFGGIPRDLSLVVAGETLFDLSYYGTEGVLIRAALTEDGDGLVRFSPKLLGPVAPQLSIRYAVSDGGGTLAKVTVPAWQGGMGLRIAKPRLWNGREDPALYTASAELLAGEEVLDRVALSVGFRSVTVDPDRGLFLNGQHLKLRGVAKHQDFEGVFSAAGPAQWDTDIALIREMGANAVRLSHYPHPQGVYDRCDAAGLLVWAEIPMLKLTQSEELLDNAKEQLQEMILQNLHHPSIFCWGIQNEIAIFGDKPWMAERMRGLNELAHALDPDRFTVCANLNGVEPDSALNRLTDLTAYNLYFGWYYGKFGDLGRFLDELHRVNPSMPFALSEYGADCNPRFHSEDPKVNDYTEEYGALFHEKNYPDVEARDFVWGSFVWNMFDFVSAIRNAGGARARNLKGLVSFDRQTKKDAYYYYKARWSEEPFVHIGGKRFEKRVGPTSVKVYSNQPEVTLTVNGEARTLRSDTGVFRFENLALNLGANPLKAQAGAVSDSCVLTGVAEPEKDYVYVEEQAGINVRNWFVDEAEEARMFPEDAYSIRDKMEVLAACPEAMDCVARLAPPLVKLIQDGIGTFSLEASIRYERPAVTEDQVKALNEALNKIDK